ncbi:uncharacterized protein PG998_012781 [Apiospora kogelbergensis]|uniref:Uncharacterized protein n=1 Tax=Apiospora kogelbergensis TaxID=1337665 RepID=A0AAW0Q976_9PEZI
MNSQIFRQATRATARFASTQARLFASSTKSAPADYGRLFQQARRTGIVYVPGLALVLGWPIAAAKVVDTVSS